MRFFGMLLFRNDFEIAHCERVLSTSAAVLIGLLPPMTIVCTDTAGVLKGCRKKEAFAIMVGLSTELRRSFLKFGEKGLGEVLGVDRGMPAAANECIEGVPISPAKLPERRSSTGLTRLARPDCVPPGSSAWWQIVRDWQGLSYPYLNLRRHLSGAFWLLARLLHQPVVRFLLQKPKPASHRWHRHLISGRQSLAFPTTLWPFQPHGDMRKT